MKQYWIRILAAWFLVRVASSLVKDAERLLKESGDAKILASDNHNGGIVEATAVETEVTDG